MTITLAMAALAVGGVVSLSQSPVVRVDVEKIELLNLGMDGIRLAVTPRIEVSRNVKLRSVKFNDLRMNGIPFHIESLQSSVELTAHAPQVLPALPVTVYYRDMGNLPALWRLIGKGAVHISGIASVEIELGPFERILLLSKTLRVNIPLDLDVEVLAILPTESLVNFR